MITEEQAQKIEKLITEVENTTRAEIVAVVVKRSSAIGHVPWVLMAILGFIFLSVEGLHFTWQEGLAALGILGLSFLLSRLAWVQRWLTPNEDEVMQVEQRAELEFHRAGLTNTTDGVGVLIFISLMERRAVILADYGVMAVVPNEVWESTISEMLSHFHRGEFVKGLELAVRHSGKILAEKLPLQSPRTSNQLPNHVILKYED